MPLFNTADEAVEDSEKLKRPIPTTPESMYGDVETEEEREERLNQRTEEFSAEMEQLGMATPYPVSEPPPYAGTYNRDKELQTKLQERYDTYVSPDALQSAKDEFKAALEAGDEEAQKAASDKILNLVTVVDEKGQRVKIPTPGSYDNAIGLTVEKAFRDTARGLLSMSAFLPNVTNEEADEIANMVATVKSDDAMVNIGAEAVPLIASGVGVAGLLGKVFTGMPRIAKYVAAYLTAPASEALVATKETEVFGAETTDSVLERKLDVMWQGMLMNAGFDTTMKLAKAASKTSVGMRISELVSSIPLVLFASAKGVQKSADQGLAEVIFQAENATTPEEKLAALQKVGDTMAENFEKLTGVKFKDYLEGKAELPDSFEPTLSDVAGSDAITAGQKGLERGPEASKFAGQKQRQREAMEGQIAPYKEGRPEAEAAATSAREEVGQAVEGRIQQQADVTGAVEGLAGRQEAATARVTEEVPIGQAKAQTAASGRLNAANRATEVLRESFLSQQAFKNSGYEKYAASVKNTPIPAAAVLRGVETVDGKQVYKGFTQVLDDLGIANPGRDLIPNDRYYRGTLNRLVDQERAFNALLEQKLAQRLSSSTDLMATGGKPRGKDVIEYGTEVLGPDDTQRLIKETLDEMRANGSYQDVNIGDLETILQSIRSGKRGQTDQAKFQAASELEDLIDGMITKSLTPEQAKLRESAKSFYQGFADVYQKSTGKPLSSKFRFGDAISDQELAEAQRGLTTILGKLGGDPAAFQFIKDVRSRMSGKQLEGFDAALSDFYVSDIYSKISSKAAVANAANDPAALASTLSKALQAAAEDPKLTQVLEIVPSVKANLYAVAKNLGDSASSTQTARAAVENANKRLGEVTKAERGSVQGKFAADVGMTDSVNAVKKLIGDPDATPKLDAIMADLSPEGIDNLRQGAGAAVMETVYKGIQEGMETGMPSLAKLNDFINNNTAFEKLFPAGSPNREVFDVLYERTKAASKTARATDITGTALGDINPENFLKSIIIYVNGPLTKQARQSGMIANALFAVNGGREKVVSALTEGFTDTRVAAQMLADVEKRIKEGLESRELAQDIVLGQYLLARLGYTSIEELKKDMEPYVMQEMTGEAFAQ